MNLSEHLSKQFDADLTALRTRVVEMGGMVDEQFRLGSRCAGDQQDHGGRRGDSQRRFGERAGSPHRRRLRASIAKRQPAASDLRMVLGVSKIVSELERIGDKARKIARLTGKVSNVGSNDAGWIAISNAWPMVPAGCCARH